MRPVYRSDIGQLKSVLIAEGLLLILWLACPLCTWSQDTSPFVSGIKILATLDSTAASWSPDGQRFAYATSDGIRVVEAPDFTQPTQLVRTGHGGAHPIRQLKWSPDGQKLAFVSSRPGDKWDTIWLTDVDGSEVRDLLRPGSGLNSPGTRSVQISAWLNNREIAFSTRCGTACLLLSTIDIANSQSRRLCIAQGEVFWSPLKNQAITEGHLGGLRVVEASHSREECPVVLEGCATRTPPWQGDEYSFDDWSPDGQTILYTGRAQCEAHLVEEMDHPSESGSSLYRRAVGSGDREKLLPHAGWAAWSPDGTSIAFLLFGEPRYDEVRRIIGTDFETGKPFRLYAGIINAATEVVRALVALGAEPFDAEKPHNWELFRPVWSPDSTRVVTRNLQKDLILIKVDGSEQRRITQEAQTEVDYEALRIQWSPDGKQLALWPLGKYFSDESRGLGTFLPPVGKKDFALSEVEIIQRYFEPILTTYQSSPEAVGGEYFYAEFLTQYARALAEMGKMDAADEQYRRGIALLHMEEKWRQVENVLKAPYVSFLCRQGREKDAAEFSGGSPCPPSTVPASRLERIQRSGIRQDTDPASKIVGVDTSSSPQQPPLPIPQPASSLYIIEVSEARK
jgi:WD40 repeat protein